MTTQEKYNLYVSDAFRNAVLFALIDWGAYWAAAGVESIEDPKLRALTAQAVSAVVADPWTMTDKVKTLAFGDDAIDGAGSVEEVTDYVINGAVTRVMASSLEYVL